MIMSTDDYKFLYGELESSKIPKDIYTKIMEREDLNAEEETRIKEVIEREKEKDMTVSELITTLNILSNDITLPVNECIEYHRAKIIVEKIYKNVIG